MANKPPPPPPKGSSSKGSAQIVGRSARPGEPARPGQRPTSQQQTPQQRQRERELASSRRALGTPEAPKRDDKQGLGRQLRPSEIRKAAAEGKRIVAYSPAEVREFLLGNRTLGELQGVSKKEQYEMAELGYVLLTEGKLKEGQEVFHGLVALDPFDAYFFTCLGSACQQLGEVEDAERCYSRALEINPYAVTARAHRGELRGESGRLLEAVDDLERVLRDDPTGREAATQRAAVLLRAIQMQLPAPTPPRTKPAAPAPRK